MADHRRKNRRQTTGAMHISKIVNKRGSRTYTSKFLRRSYRDKNGRSQKETLAVLSDLPDSITDVMSDMLKGEQFAKADDSVEIIETKIHGPSQAVSAAIQRLDIPRLIGGGRDSKEQKIISTLIGARILFPKSKLATTRRWKTTSLPTLFGLEGDTDQNDIYRAMDWLIQRQDKIQEKIGPALFRSNGIALYDLTSTYFEGETCPIAKRGYSRDKKKGKLQVNIGLLCNSEGCPAAISVYEGNIHDSKTIMAEVHRLKHSFGLAHIIIIADRGMISQPIMNQLKAVDGVIWVTAMRSSSIAALADSKDFAGFKSAEFSYTEIKSQKYPHERLIACYNPDLAKRRAQKRSVLIRETFTELLKLRLSHRKSAFDAKTMAFKVGKVIGKFKMGKHICWRVNDKSGQLFFARNKACIAREAKVDGVYVVRTPIDNSMSAAECILRYKSLSQVESAFRYLKTSSLLIRPVHHRIEERVRSHVFICMLAYYVEWHMRLAWRSLTFSQEANLDYKEQRNPVQQRNLSDVCRKKIQTQKTQSGEIVHSFDTLLHSLESITLNKCRFKGICLKDDHREQDGTFHIQSTPNAEQKRVLSMIKDIQG